MSEIAALRRLRATNSKLMKGNLALLMSIRESDCAIEEEWRELQQCCELLERNGQAIPPSCLALMGAAETEPVPQDVKESEDDKLLNDDPEEAPPSNGEKQSKRPTSSALSVRSVLNAEPSDDDDANHNSGDSASDHESIDES